MAKKKTPKTPPLETWNFTETQKLLLTEQARAHQAELQPFVQYQSRARNDLLEQIRKEFDIPEGLPLNVELDNMRFVERPASNVVPLVPPAKSDKKPA